jgi:hypothetical protein
MGWPTAIVTPTDWQSWKGKSKPKAIMTPTDWQRESESRKVIPTPMGIKTVIQTG